MKRCWSVSLLLLACAAPARAHFVWIVPEKGEVAQLIFSDNLEPDPKVPIAKIAQTELFTRDASGKTTTLKATLRQDSYRVVSPAKGASLLGGVCRFGVVQRGKAEPFLLVYHAKALLGTTPGTPLPAGIWRPWDALALEIVPLEGLATARVLWQGKPLPDAEVVLLVPGQDKAVERKTDKEGRFSLEKTKAGGVYGIRARHVVAKEGEQDGKKYKEVRHYATLTFPVAGTATKSPDLKRPGGTPPNAEATKLLRDARAARASWAHFTGFSADLEFNHGGKVVRGLVEVSAEGRVKVDLPDAAAKAWAQRQLQSVVDHRLDSSAGRDTPCAFLDDNATHPLGRAIRVLNDELHSSYRIRGLEIIEVNRSMKEGRFTITVLENRLTAEKKYLPTVYVVNTWGGEALRSAMAFHQTWQRVGAFDLPQSILVVTATGGTPTPTGTLDSRSLTLTNHKLAR